MARTILVLIFVVAMVFVANAQLQGDECPENMEWTNCGSACPRSCNSRPHQACTMQCVVGCRCKGNYVLSGNGGCIEPRDC